MIALVAKILWRAVRAVAASPEGRRLVLVWAIATFGPDIVVAAAEGIFGDDEIQAAVAASPNATPAEIHEGEHLALPAGETPAAPSAPGGFSSPSLLADLAAVDAICQTGGRPCSRPCCCRCPCGPSHVAQPQAAPAFSDSYLDPFTESLLEGDLS